MTTSLWKLRRLAPRALRVVERHKAESTAIAAHQAPLAAKTQPFVAAYDEVVRLRANAADAGARAVGALYATVRAWLPLAQRDVQGFLSADFGGRPEVADDVIADGEALARQVRDGKALGDASLPYQAACVSEVEQAVAAATAGAKAAEAADAGYGGLMARLRQAAAQLDGELQAVRATLSARLGRRDGDLQKMRPRAVFEPDPDDDGAAPGPSPGVLPAGPGVNAPLR